MVRLCKINKARYSKGLKVKYRVYKDENYVETPTIKGTLSPEFNHTKVIEFDKVTQDHTDFFMNGFICFQVYGLQEDTTPDARMAKMTTKVRAPMLE